MPATVRFKKFCQSFGETGDNIVALVTITSEIIANPIRLNSTLGTVVSQGRTFTGAGLDFVMPAEGDNAQQSILTITLPAISQQIIKFLDEHPSRFDVEFEIVLQSTPDVTELGPYLLKSDRSTIDYKTGQGQMDCIFNRTLDLPLVTKKFSHRMIPGAYGAGTD